MRGQRHALAALYPRERPGTHCTGGWVGPRAGLDRCGKISHPPGFDPRTVQPVASRYTDWAIAAHTKVFGSPQIKATPFPWHSPVITALHHIHYFCLHIYLPSRQLCSRFVASSECEWVPFVYWWTTHIAMPRVRPAASSSRRYVRGLQYCLLCSVYFCMLAMQYCSVVSFTKICREFIPAVMAGTVFYITVTKLSYMTYICI